MDIAIDLWIGRTDRVPHHLLRDRFLNHFLPQEIERYRSLVHEEDRHVYLLAHALLRVALSDRLGGSIEDLQFRTDPRGKPHLTDGVRRCAEFSLSHTRGLAVCAISASCAVGVDVESIARGAELEGIATRFLCAEERERLATFTQARRAEELLDLWTCKEALLKASGLGMAEPMRNICLTLCDKGIELAWPGSTPNAWGLTRFRIDDEFVGAVAVSGSGDVLRTLHVRTNDDIDLKPATSQTLLPQGGIFRITT